MPRKELISGEWKKVCSKADCHKAGIPQPVEGFSKNKNKRDGLQYQCKKCEKAHAAEYYAENKAHIKARDAEYKSRPENKARANQRKRDRYHSDPAYRLRCIVSNSICQALKAKGKTKGGSTFDYLPYSPEGLAEHLEKQFDEHMTWDNHGTYWHIDHIRPHASFKYDSLDHPEFQKCWALENLRPLEASENIRKNSFWEGKRHYHNEAV
jgi:5-methylcytosine-specific restriction endonuclease McrA